MVNFDLLRVSLTKNGYFKVAELLKGHPRSEVLDYAEGHYKGINVKRSQLANMLDGNPTTGHIPEYWDSIRVHGHQAIDAFTVVAMLFSHHRFIRLLQTASEGRPEFAGYFLRTDLTTKEFTNLAYALGCFGLWRYRRAAGAVEYTLAPVVYRLRSVGSLVRDLLEHKLKRAGWRDPRYYRTSPDREFMVEAQSHQLHRVFSMTWPLFSDWMEGRLRIKAPEGPFGIREVGLFDSPIQSPVK
jgi:hypothetical protein